MNKLSLIVFSFIILFYGCSSPQTVTKKSQPAPEPKAEPTPVDFSSLQEPPKKWHLMDEEETRFRGISSELAYKTILKDKQPAKEVVVAVIDGGVDANHEDLKEVMWINEDEVPGNGKDDDQNGYIDDINGWNFIGGADGKNVNHDTFELTRIYRRLHKEFANADTSSMKPELMQRYSEFQEIQSDYEQKIRELSTQYNNISSLENSKKQAEKILSQHFGNSDYSLKQVQDLQPNNQQLAFAQNVMSYVMENNIDSTLIAEQKKQIYEFAKYGYNPNFYTRNIVGDNYEDKKERSYGNNDVAGPDASHGTHVAGIVAAARGNNTGIDGVATNTRIMAVRAVPNGDERDKDVANAIRYAVDNGADVINMSFGKAYSPYKEVVDAAIQHAQENGVLMVHGAGNDAKDIDENASYPTDVMGRTAMGRTADLWISVGATSWKPNDEFVASFSNYGDQKVDIFAPGVDIYSTMPDNKYKFQDGTSMASPVVAGAAALIMAYYPKLSAKDIRKIILQNVTSFADQQVILPNQQGAEEPMVSFGSLSATGGVVNIYKALQAAERMSK